MYKFQFTKILIFNIQVYFSWKRDDEGAIYEQLNDILAKSLYFVKLEELFHFL